MENSIAVFTLTVLIVPIGATFSTTECPCGYGGLCLDIEGISCSACENVSNGWYETDCHTIVNHCEPKKCNNGKCIPTFGGYYCVCPKKYSGLNCEVWDGNEMIKATNRVSIYYQIQPIPTGTGLFTVVYDAEESEFDKWNIEWNVTITDGRRYYPGRNQFVRRNVYDDCVRDADLYPALLDLRICALLPIRSVLTFSFDPYLSIPLSEPEGLVFAPGLTEAIGRTGKVSIELRASMNGNMTVLHLHNYALFTYYNHLRMTNKCFMEIIFNECSTSDKYPVFHPRGEQIKIHAIQSHSHCDGVRVFKKSWYHQSHVEGKRDPVPILMEGETDLVLVVPAHFMSHGTHMFLFEYTLQGNPPHFGGTTIFTKTGHCWIWSEMGVLDVHLKGGDERTSSCLTPLNIPFENKNRNMDLLEMTFFMSCDHVEDPECNLTVSEVPVLKRKRRAECGSIYRYTITVVDAHLLSTSIRAVISFVPQNVELGIEILDERRFGAGSMGMVKITYRQYLLTKTWCRRACKILFHQVNLLQRQVRCVQNCDPLDPRSRVIWVAYTLPYIQGPVTWSITVGILDDHYEDQNVPVQSFHPATASRIFVMKPEVLRRRSAVLETVALQVSHGFLYAKHSAEIQNIELLATSFVLERLYGKEGKRYKYGYAGLFRPKMFMKYTIFMIDIFSFGAVELLTTDYEEFLEFNPFWRKACLCAMNLDFTLACSAFESTQVDQKAAETPNITEVSELLTLGRVGHFLRRADYLLWRNVQPLNRFEFGKWRMSVKDRNTVLKLVQQVISIHTLQVDLITILHMHSMLFYSTTGNYVEYMPHFEEETYSDNIVSGIEWLELRHEALKSLLYIAETIEYKSKMERYKNLLKFPFGNYLEYV